MAKKPHSKNPLNPVELRSLAEDRLKVNQESVPSVTSSPEEMLRVVHELQVHQIELEMQQEELARTRNDLEESLANYTELYDFAPVGYLTLGRESKIQRANLTASKLLGVDRSGLVGKRFKQFCVPEDYRVIDTLLETVFSNRVPGSCDVKLLTGYDSERSIRMDAVLFSRILLRRRSRKKICAKVSVTFDPLQSRWAMKYLLSTPSAP